MRILIHLLTNQVRLVIVNENMYQLKNNFKFKFYLNINIRYYKLKTFIIKISLIILLY